MNRHDNQYLSVKDICHTLIPVSESTWWRGVRKQVYPQPVSIGRRKFWKSQEITLLQKKIDSEGLPIIGE